MYGAMKIGANNLVTWSTGDPNPKITGGIYNEFSYKNFSVGILGTFTIGRDIINNFASPTICRGLEFWRYK